MCCGTSWWCSVGLGSEAWREEGAAPLAGGVGVSARRRGRARRAGGGCPPRWMGWPVIEVNQTSRLGSPEITSRLRWAEAWQMPHRVTRLWERLLPPWLRGRTWWTCVSRWQLQLRHWCWSRRSTSSRVSSGTSWSLRSSLGSASDGRGGRSPSSRTRRLSSTRSSVSVSRVSGDFDSCIRACSTQDRSVSPSRAWKLTLRWIRP